MVPSPAIAPSSTDGLSTLHHPSSMHLSPYKSLHNPSITQKPDKTSNTTVPAPLAFSDSQGRRSPRAQSKRKRDSEPHIIANGSQLREAQERVEQKRAKIAARVPSAMAPGNANATPAPVTSLADLYARMRRDTDASSRRDNAAIVSTPSPTTAGPRNGRILHRRPPQNNNSNAPPRGAGRSTASSPDPIAMSEDDDQEIVVLKHVRPSSPSSPQVRPRLESAAWLGRTPPHLNLKSLSQAAKPMMASPLKLKSTATNGANKLLDKAAARKAKPNFAVVIPSPPKRPTLKPASVERNTPVRNASQSKDSTPAGAPAPSHTERLKEITNGKSPESPVPRIPSSAPVRPARSVESIPESLPDPTPRRLRRAEDLTARDIDALLGAVPIRFDFSLSHRHQTTRDDDDDDDDDWEKSDEEGSLWWHHPIFEARAKADIRRTLGALLPADPAQDPPPIASDDSGGGGSWRRAEVHPRQSGARMWVERLEGAFGPGPLDRGMGRKPRRVARPAGAAKRGADEGSRSKNGEVHMGAVVIANPHGPAHRILEPPRQPSPSSQPKPPNDTVDAVPRPPATNTSSLALVEAAAETNVSDDEAAAAWTAALLPLVKGKTTMDGARLAQTSDALSEVERADIRGGLVRDVLKESALADTVRRLGELENVPLGDVHRLRPRARRLAHRWREAFGDDVVDLQHDVLLHLPK